MTHCKSCGWITPENVQICENCGKFIPKYQLYVPAPHTNLDWEHDPITGVPVFKKALPVRDRSKGYKGVSRRVRL